MIRLLFIFFAIISFNNSVFAESRLQTILKNGEIRVGTTGDWNPMTVKDPATNEYIGFEIEIVKQLAKDMDVNLVIIPTEWKTLVNGIVSNKYDISTSASLSAKRALSTGYTDSYFKLATVPLTLKKNLNKFQNWEDINKQGVKVVSYGGGTDDLVLDTTISPTTSQTLVFLDEYHGAGGTTAEGIKYPKGLTIYGNFASIELDSGKVIAYSK